MYKARQATQGSYSGQNIDWFGGYHLISVTGPTKRLKAIKSSGMRRFFALARDMPNCINLSVGEPDFSPPQHILKTGFQAAAEGNTHYSRMNGIPELREALSQKVYKDCGLRYDPDSEVLVTVGGTEAFLATLLAWLNPGEKVLILNPGFVVFEPSALLAEGKPVHVPLLEANNF